jgi:hypothetical protein
MDIRAIDPRDQTGAVERPSYRVYFWKPPPSARGESQVGRLYTSDEYQLDGCRNVREALAWADENAGPGRSYTLYAVTPADNGITLSRLFGVDPTRSDGEAL